MLDRKDEHDVKSNSGILKRNEINDCLKNQSKTKTTPLAYFNICER